MSTRIAAALVAALFCLFGCGGGQEQAKSPASADSGIGGGEETDTPLEQPETMDAIRRVFERKSNVVARCFADAVTAGELPESAKGFVTVGTTISPGGKPTKVGVLETNLESATLETCVVRTVSGWDFPKPHADYLTSYTYRFEEF